jgi:SAM-dependent methyltransferase
MTHQLAAAVRLLGASRRYADGSEQRVLEALARAHDRRDGSDELRRLASDWPTTYHLSPRRSNLLRPFKIGPGLRVLEVGAGTGALTRHLGERGANVLAIEGDPTRAQAAALRCSDLPNVEVVCGLFQELADERGFDLVVVVGVLEYAGGAPGASHPHLDFLNHAGGLVREGGALILAIENQIGLKYLLGFSEDHVDEPWAGLAGYPGNPAVRTFSRAGLRSLLETSGLPAQRWYYPYPDYKMPSAILAVEAFEVDGATDFVDQLVGLPVRDLASPPTLFCDSRAAHRVFLDAGLGPDVANSFLVLAGRGTAELESWIDPEAVAWHFASERRRRWRRFHVVRREGDALHLISRPIHDGDRPAPAEWMQQLSSKDESYVPGLTVEQEALDACRRRDLDALRAVLACWHTSLLHNERPAPPPVAAHPYAATGARALPPDFFDASLSNFVNTGGMLTFVDREWHVGTGVDPDLARFRALWYLAVDLVVSGVEQPFEPGATVTDITRRLVEMVDVVAETDLIERFYSAEAEVQAIVTGADAAAIDRDLRHLGATSRSESAAASTLPVNRVRRDLIELGESLEPLRNRIADLEAAIGERDRQIEAVSAELVRVADWARSLESELRRAQRWATELNEQASRKVEIEEALTAELGRLDLRSQKLARELEQYRAWEAKWTRKPLVRAALVLHRLLGGSNSSH